YAPGNGWMGSRPFCLRSALIRSTQALQIGSFVPLMRTEGTNTVLSGMHFMLRHFDPAALLTVVLRQLLNDRSPMLAGGLGYVGTLVQAVDSDDVDESGGLFICARLRPEHPHRDARHPRMLAHGDEDSRLDYRTRSRST